MGISKEGSVGGASGRGQYVGTSYRSVGGVLYIKQLPLFFFLRATLVSKQQSVPSKLPNSYMTN